MRKADAQPSVNAPVPADPVVHYTINSTVNSQEYFPRIPAADSTRRRPARRL